MPHSPRIAFGLVCAILTCASCRRVAAAEDFSFYHENVLGTSLELCVRAETIEGARRAESRVLEEIDRLDAIMSGYRAASEFCRWQAAPKGPVQVSAELYEVLAASDYWQKASGGAFDPRVEALSQLWSCSCRLGRLPTAQETTRAKALLLTPAWRLGPAPGMVERLSDCPLSLNGIAKGYIVERACEAAWCPADEVSGLALNLGGDLRVRGDVARTVGIASPWSDSESSDPLESIAVKNRSVATSGSSQRGFMINGKWYSHVFDPRNGWPVERIKSATVVAFEGPRRGRPGESLRRARARGEPAAGRVLWLAPSA